MNKTKQNWKQNSDSVLIISSITLKDTDLYTVNSYKYLKSVGVEI